MSYGGYGRGYGQEYDYRNSDRQGAQGYHGVPPPGPYMGSGGNQHYPPSVPGFPSTNLQGYQPPLGPMGSGRQVPPVDYSQYDRGQVYQSPAAPSMNIDYDRRDGRDWNKTQEPGRETGSYQGSSQSSSKKPTIDIDAILKDERLKNVLFSGISKATQKLEESLRAKNSEDNVNFLKEQRQEQSSQLFPSASSEGQQKPKSILKRSDGGGNIQAEKLSVLEKTLQLLRGKTNVDSGPDTRKDLNVSHPSAALGQLSSYSDDPEDEEAHLYGEKNTSRKSTSQRASQSKNLPFWSVGAAPSETEASKRDSGSAFDMKEKLYEEWRNTLNKKEPEKSKPEVSQLQAFISNQMNAETSRKKQSSGARDNEELDSTVQNILQSIGFNFDLSKRMQELAKQKKKEHDEMQTGIVDQRASFLENAQGIEDMKAQLFSGGSSSIDSFIKQARAETQNSRASYEKHSERSRSPDFRGRHQQRDRSSSRDKSSRYYTPSPERRIPSEWSPIERGEYRRYDKQRRSVSSERSAATPPRGSYGKSESRGHRVSERFRDEPKDEYYYPDEHEANEVPPSLPLLTSYSSHRKKEDLTSGLFPSAKRLPQNSEVENFTVMSKAVDDGDGSFTGTRRIILPSKSDRRVVSKSKSPSFRGSQSPYKKSLKRSASPLSPRPSKERRYHNTQVYDQADKPKWNDPKYDMKITTFRDRSPMSESAHYQSPLVTYDRDDYESRREVSRGAAYGRDYSLDIRYEKSPDRERETNFEYGKQWVDSRGSQERFQSPKRFRSRSPEEYKYKHSPRRFKSPVWDKDRSPQRERTRSSPRRKSPERGRSPGRRKSPSHERRRSPSSGKRRSPSPGRRRSPSFGRRRSPSPGRRRDPYRRSYDHKRDFRSKFGGKNQRDNKKYSPRVPFDKSKFTIDRRNKNSQDDKNKKAPQDLKVDLSKMSESERKAHLSKLLEEKEKAAAGLAKTLSTASTAQTSSTVLSVKKEQVDKVTGVKSAKSSQPLAGSSDLEKSAADISKMKAEEINAHFGKTEIETHAKEELQSNLISAIERLSTLSVGARKEILLKMTRMTQLERQEAMNNLSMRQVKVTTLKAHLEKLRKEQNELMRKSRRSGLGSQDPQLIKNSADQDRTQTEIDRLSAFDPEKPFAEIEMSPPPSHKLKDKTPPLKKKSTTEVKGKPESSKTSGEGSAVSIAARLKEISESHPNENWKVITDAETNELPDLGEPIKNASKSRSGKKDNEDEKGKGQNSSTSSSSFGSVQAKVYYEYIDGGNHWCKFCRTKCNGIDQLFEHLHGKKHMSKIEKEPRPWKDSKSAKTSNQQKVGRACTRRIKGAEMLFPVVGFHCALCKLILPDFTDAADHLKSDSHYNKYLDYIKVNPGYEKKLLLERTTNIKLSRERLSPEPQPPPPPPTAPPPPPPPLPSINKKQDRDKSKKQLRRSGREASSGSEDEFFEFGADNTTVEDMELDEEEEQEAARAAKSKVPKLSGKDPSWGLAAAASMIQSSDNMKESKEEQDKPLGQFLSIAEGSDLSEVPVVPPKIDLKTIPIPTGPPTLSEMPQEPETKCTVKTFKDIDDEEKKMMGIDVDAEEEQPLKAIPVPPPSHRKEIFEPASSNETARKKPKSLDTLFAKVNSRLANKIAPKVTAGKTIAGNTPSEMELRIQQEIKQKLLKEKLKIVRKKQKEEERAKKQEEPRRKKKILSDSSSDDSSEESFEATQSIPSKSTDESQERLQDFQTQAYSDFSEIPMPPGLSSYEAYDEQNMMFQDGLIVLSEVSADKDESAQEDKESSSEEDDDEGDDDDDADEPLAFTLAGSVALQALMAASTSNMENTDNSTPTPVSRPKKKKAPLSEKETVCHSNGESAVVIDHTSVPISGTENAAGIESAPVSLSDLEDSSVKSVMVSSSDGRTTAAEPYADSSTTIENEDLGEKNSVSLPDEGSREHLETASIPPEVGDEVIEVISSLTSEEEGSKFNETNSALPSEEEGAARLSDLAAVLSSEGESTEKVDSAQIIPPDTEKSESAEAATSSPMETEDSAIEPTEMVSIKGGDSAVAECNTCLSSDTEVTSTVLSPPSLLSDKEIATVAPVEEEKQNQNSVSKWGRGKGKRGSGPTRGRGRGKRNVQQHKEDPDMEEAAKIVNPESSELLTAVDFNEPESVIIDQSPGRKRGRGRRGQATKKTSGKGRVTRSRGIRNEDTTEQDIFSSTQAKHEQDEVKEPHVLYEAETYLFEKEEACDLNQCELSDKSYEPSQADICLSQVETEGTYQATQAETSVELDVGHGLGHIGESETVLKEAQEPHLNETSQVQAESALESNQTEVYQVQMEAAYEPHQMEASQVEIKDNNEPHLIQASQVDVEDILELKQAEILEQAIDEPKQAEFYQVDLDKAHKLSQNEISLVEFEEIHQPSLLAQSQVEESCFDQTNDLMISDFEAEAINSEGIVSDPNPHHLQNADQEDALTSEPSIVAQNTVDKVSFQSTFTCNAQDGEGDITDTMEDQIPDLQYQVFEQPQSLEYNGSDSDATITDDLEVQSAFVQLDEPRTDGPLSLHETSIEPNVWDIVSTSGLVEDNSQSTSDAIEATALQPITLIGSPGMDPPMSGVISEMDESINAVTFTEEEGLPEGADEDAPSAGLTLGIEDPDDSLDFANAMKDVDS